MIPGSVTSTTATLTITSGTFSTPVTLTLTATDTASSSAPGASSTPTTTSAAPGGSPTPGDSIRAVAQAFLFTPPDPTDDDTTDPYSGPFSVFQLANLNADQEAVLLNRSYYFKGRGQVTPAQVVLSANTSSPLPRL
ncbi:hypothetical protein H9P43_005039 [Blastocladiella emersonii ATCC 22665]|nr:hypothetical protein H9P43_005039 [Blastocladiella emersonii ATCC 22665]